MDIQVSLMRILINDNGAVPTYSDAQLRSAITFGPTAPALPMDVRLAGNATARTYPSDSSGGPFTGPF